MQSNKNIVPDITFRNKAKCDNEPGTKDNCTTVGRPVITHSCPLRGLGASTARVVSRERTDLFISGFMQIYNKVNLRWILFAILKALLPFLCCDDICDIRFARPKAPGRSDLDSADSPPLL